MNKLNEWLKEYWSCLLVLLAIYGFVGKALYNYPIGLMAILGFFVIIQNSKSLLKDTIIKAFALTFLCLWLPLLASLPDAVNLTHSAQTAFPYLRFFFAGIFIIHELSKNNNRLKFVVAGIFFIVLFWTIDASIQFIFHENLLGFPYVAGEITGMFYPRNTISHICSILSGICFLYIYIKFDKKKWLLISLVPLFLIILLSGRRAAWIMLALSSFGFFIYLYLTTANKKQLLKITGLITACLSLLLVATIVFHGPTNKRFKVTLGLFSNNYQTIDEATARRLPLWETAVTIFKLNPINGIGPRGYRHVYTQYSKPDDFWHEESQTHPHLLILELLAETGLIGLMGYILLLFFIFKLFYKSTKRLLLFPFLIPVMVAIFPFNAHMAFYGSIWSSMSLLLMALFFTQAKLISKNNGVDPIVI